MKRYSTVKAVVTNHRHAAVSKLLAASSGRRGRVHVLVGVGVCPTANAEHDLQVTVLGLEKLQLLHGTVDVVAAL